MMIAGAMLVLVVEDMVAIFAGQLGLIHGLVGLAQQLIRVHLFRLRIVGDAEAGRHLHDDRRSSPARRGGEQTLEHRHTGVAVPRSTSTATNSSPPRRARVSPSRSVCFIRREGDQQLVAGGMSVAVIDGLEAIQIQIGHCQLSSPSLGLRHGLVQTVGQQHAVGQPVSAS